METFESRSFVLVKESRASKIALLEEIDRAPVVLPRVVAWLPLGGVIDQLDQARVDGDDHAGAAPCRVQAPGAGS